jgi:hypothetical protein
MEGLIRKPFMFRSRIHQLPRDVRIAIAEVAYQKQMYADQRKQCIIERLIHHGIEWTELGTGTNRFIIKFDGFALKTALDREGIADNKQEWVIDPQLRPGDSEAHEISKGGHLLVASYVPAFTSFGEMREYENQIRKILKGWSTRFLLGDVGFTSINYANWGVKNRQPKCIDYAYIFPANMDLFQCVCGNKHMVFTGNDYTTYKCTKCGTEYSDREIRSRISNEERLRLFSDSTSNSIIMKSPTEEHIVEVPVTAEKRHVEAPDPRDVANDVMWRYNGRYY